MALPFREMVLPFCFGPTDNSARLVLGDVTAEPDAILSFRGTLAGPFCSQARTLPTTFPVASQIEKYAGRAVADILVTDPCYWTPALPFLYRLELEVEYASGAKATVSQAVGLRRWRIDGSNWTLEGKRIVLRGAMPSKHAASDVAAARESEVALIVSHPGDVFCEEADRVGVALIADLRGAAGDLQTELMRLAWHPAVMVVMLDEDAPAVPAARQPVHVVANLCRPDGATPPIGDASAARVFASELAPQASPPSWLKSCDCPVIAIRRGVPYADFHEARAACDRLQAELSPQFNLAGYFVAAD